LYDKIFSGVLKNDGPLLALKSQIFKKMDGSHAELQCLTAKSAGKRLNESHSLFKFKM